MAQTSIGRMPDMLDRQRLPNVGTAEANARQESKVDFSDWDQLS